MARIAGKLLASCTICMYILGVLEGSWTSDIGWAKLTCKQTWSITKYLAVDQLHVALFSFLYYHTIEWKTTNLSQNINMTITALQKTAIEEIINIIINTSPPRGKRHLSSLFLELVDRTEWPEYYEVCSFRLGIQQSSNVLLDHTRTTLFKWHSRQCRQKQV